MSNVATKKQCEQGQSGRAIVQGEAPATMAGVARAVLTLKPEKGAYRGLLCGWKSGGQRVRISERVYASLDEVQGAIDAIAGDMPCGVIAAMDITICEANGPAVYIQDTYRWKLADSARRLLMINKPEVVSEEWPVRHAWFKRPSQDVPYVAANLEGAGGVLERMQEVVGLAMGQCRDLPTMAQIEAYQAGRGGVGEPAPAAAEASTVDLHTLVDGGRAAAEAVIRDMIKRVEAVIDIADEATTADRHSMFAGALEQVVEAGRKMVDELLDAGGVLFAASHYDDITTTAQKLVDEAHGAWGEK